MNNSQPLKNDVRYLAVLVGLALAIGIYLIATCVVIDRDGVFYIGQARRLADDPLAVARRYPIGYPFLLSVAHRAMGLLWDSDSALAWAYSSQSVTLLTRVLALIPLYFLGKRLVGGQRSFLALLVLIVLPYPADYGSNALREWPFVLFLSLGFWLLVRALQERQWWTFGLVGLSAGLGYLIRPMCAQLVVYGVLALLGAFLTKGPKVTRKWLGAGLLLMTGFAVPVLPSLAWTGRVVPPQLKPAPGNNAPVIVSVGGKSASQEPLQFEVAEGELLELRIEADDRDGDALTFSVVTVPLGTRPVHRLWSAANRASFWTISEHQKNALLETYGPGIWDYDGIAYYAYTSSDVTGGLEPVHRFWSPASNRHFYTIGESEQENGLEGPDAWQKEGIAFYAFGEGGQPPEAIPVYRFGDATGEYSWSTGDAAGADGIAWYAHAGAEPPAGSRLEAGTFRWRAEPNQQGEYQLNVIVSDGKRPSCQLVRIRVGRTSKDQRAGVFRVPAAIMDIVRAMNDTLMVFFLLPLCLGLYHHFKHEGEHHERVLMAAVVVVNVGLMLARSLWVQPEVGRRYCLAMIVLTVFYIPKGLELMAHGLRTLWAGAPEWPWFHILLASGIAICIPRLLTPIGHDKTGYREAVQWLQENTGAHQVVAVPDKRISFYAERKALTYKRHADPRKADFIVTITRDGAGELGPEDWSQEYSLSFGKKRKKTLRIYRGPLEDKPKP